MWSCSRDSEEARYRPATSVEFQPTFNSIETLVERRSAAIVAVMLMAGRPGNRIADPGALHHMVAIACGGLDSLPHNGYVVTTIRGVCRETHNSASWPMFCMTVIVPLLGLVVALVML
jgi:H+/gluconate symporter-like permease